VVSAGEQLRRLLAEAGATESSALAAAARVTEVEAQLHAHVTGLEKGRMLHRDQACWRTGLAGQIIDYSTVTTEQWTI
jgi:hypothetical protein